MFGEKKLEKEIKEKNMNLISARNELARANDKNNELENTLNETNKKIINVDDQKTKIENYQKTIKKLNNNKKRMTRDIKICQNRIARMKKELKQKRETTINSSPA